MRVKEISTKKKSLIPRRFLIELSRGFMFVGSQQRIILHNTHYYVDMGFYYEVEITYVSGSKNRKEGN